MATYTASVIIRAEFVGFDTLEELKGVPDGLRADTLYLNTSDELIRRDRFFAQTHVFHRFVGDDENPSAFSRDEIIIMANRACVLTPSDFKSFTAFAFRVTNYIIDTVGVEPRNFDFEVVFSVTTPEDHTCRI